MMFGHVLCARMFIVGTKSRSWHMKYTSFEPETANRYTT